jgi:hypothetical protein
MRPVGGEVTTEAARDEGGTRWTPPSGGTGPRTVLWAPPRETSRCAPHPTDSSPADARRVRVKPVLTRDVGCDEIRLPNVARIARRHTGPRAGRAPTTRDARHSEGNYQSYIEDRKKKKRKGADADQPHRLALQ